MSRILVTGATSYLGAALTRRLAESDVDETHIVVRATSDLHRLGPAAERVGIHVHDGTTEGLVAILQETSPDLVFHLAAVYRREHAPEDVEDLVQANVLFGLQLLEAMRASGTTRIVNTGSFFQWYDGDRALNLYAATKQAFQTLLDYYADAYGLEWLTLVLFDVYGPGDPRAKLVTAIVDALDNDTLLALPADDPLIELVHVDDVVAAFLHAAGLLSEGSRTGESLAVASGEPQRLSEIVRLCEELAGKDVEASWGAFPTPSRRIVEPWAGPRLPGWEPRVSLRAGIGALIDATKG